MAKRGMTDAQSIAADELASAMRSAAAAGLTSQQLLGVASRVAVEIDIQTDARRRARELDEALARIQTSPA